MQDVRNHAGMPLLLLGEGRDIVIAARHVEGWGIRYVTLTGGDWTLLPPWTGPHPFGTKLRMLPFRRRSRPRWRAVDAEVWRWLLPEMSAGT